MPGALLDLPGDPGHCLGTHFGAKVPVEGGRGATLHRKSHWVNMGKPQARVSQPAGPSLGATFLFPGEGLYLLHVPQHIFPAVEDTLPLLRVEVVDEVGGVVLVAPLVPAPGEGDGLMRG